MKNMSKPRLMIMQQGDNTFVHVHVCGLMMIIMRTRMSPVLRSHASHGSNLACGLMPGQPLATARRSQRFSDSPCRCRLRFEPERRPGGKCLACLGLHQRLVVLEAAKEELSNLAALQREELQYLNNRWGLR